MAELARLAKEPTLTKLFEQDLATAWPASSANVSVLVNMMTKVNHPGPWEERSGEEDFMEDDEDDHDSMEEDEDDEDLMEEDEDDDDFMEKVIWQKI